jgi:DNA-binding NarL/FixJ family response regulator
MILQLDSDLTSDWLTLPVEEHDSKNDNPIRERGVPMTTILIADDHKIVRDGLRSLLEAEPDFEVVGEAASGTRALELALNLRPDLIVLDIGMPDLNGLEVLRQMQLNALETRAIVLSMYADQENVLTALQNGAMGYILKDYGVTDLTRAIREILGGHHYLSPSLADHVITSFLAKSAAGKSLTREGLALLTDREVEVMKLCAVGYEIEEIAATLLISINTVKTHRSNMMRKLDLHSQSAITRYALEHGLLTLKP